MNKIAHGFLLAMLAISLGGCSSQQDSPSTQDSQQAEAPPTDSEDVSITATQTEDVQPAAGPSDIELAAKRFVDQLEAGDFAGAVATFDATMTQAMPPDKLEGAWTSVLASAGAFKQQIGVRTEKAQGYDVVLVTCQFERGNLDAKVVYSDDGKITGLWFAPAASGSAEKYTPPDYAKQDSFREEEVQVGSGEWALPGTLTRPLGDGPFPAVVLVHGSGPNDRDETIGPNKPFRDLAWGLASKAVAVLRYEKRTKQHQLKLAQVIDTFTVKEETIDDALAAVKMLQGTDGIDSSRVFVLGHSLGGMLVPRIAAGDPQAAGFIIFAGTTRPFEDVYLEQATYILSLDGEVSQAEAQQLEEIEAQVALAKSPDLSSATPAAELPLGVPANYWLDLRGYDPAQAAKDVKQPMLVMQGGRDYQVTHADYQLWQQALSDREDVLFKLYPKCNHLFIEGEGKCTPNEYLKAGNVAEAVIADVAEWIVGSR